MRLTSAFTWFGFELSWDFYVGESTCDDEADDEPARGDALSVPIGFTRPEIPWDADGPVHQYDPTEADEDHRS